MNTCSTNLLKKKAAAITFWAIFITIVVIGFYLRVHEIDNRLFHNDEGVNYHFIQDILNKGYYPYSHLNYHGPAHFYLTNFLMEFFGDGELGVRMSAILCGGLLIIALIPLGKLVGRDFLIISAALTALAPSLVFYSRYCIHESLFLLSTFGVALAVYAWHITRRSLWIYVGFCSIAVLVATKETFIISLFCIGISALTLGDSRQVINDLINQRRALFFGALVALVLVILLFTGGLQWPGGLREMFLAVPQWMGRNESDVGHHKAFGYYLELIRIAEPHLMLHPLVALLNIEQFVSNLDITVVIPLLACIFFGLHAYHIFPVVRSKEFAFYRFIFSWSTLSLLVYSFVKYKTPWLIINITFPLILFVACLLSLLVRHRSVRTLYLGATSACVILLGILFLDAEFLLSISSGDFWKTVRHSGSPWSLFLRSFTLALIFAYLLAYIVPPRVRSYMFGWSSVAVVCALSAALCWHFSFQNLDTKKNRYFYVHTTPGMQRLVEDLEAYWKNSPQSRVLIAAKQYWPLPYYLRRYKDRVNYLVSDDFNRYKKRYDVLIMSPAATQKPAGWHRKYYRLSDVQESNTFFKVSSYRSTE